ncbi:hypothetical protein RhiXN_00858 [Rhizoctonia solani]|uniref:Uncharacterized protein n=1 Tax=Rhizoctonia solani TaxID=456999 RepID=A0A8H8SWE9_9AGAM|nr:uncharacterized protein RhiXN_00858 [Rhizoctonia solani]QRW19452.1 hypothetical protein RhiXN_00858 [Rhizoctonia solani]
MSFNHIFLLQDLDYRKRRLQAPSVFRPTPRKRLSSECCLPTTLPSLSSLDKVARNQIPRTEVRQLRQRSTSSEGSSSSENSDDAPTSPSQPRADDARGYTPQKSTPSARPKVWKEPEHWEVVQAIEKRDVVKLSEIRDYSFHVLLRRVNNTSPLEHAVRIGYTDMAILILGMFSRWINYLDEEDFSRKKVMINLNAIRINLRFAITQGLQHNQPNLISSYLQTIVMSHGEAWLKASISDVARELNQGSEGKPAHMAITSIKNFFTRELAKADSIITVDEYVANAGCDLLMLGAWNIAMQKLPNGLRDECRAHLPKKLQWQMKVMKKTIGIRTYGIYQKLEILKEELDGKE